MYCTQRFQNLLEITLSLMVLKITDIFHFQQNLIWRPKFGKLKIFRGRISRVYGIQRVQNLLQITLFLTLFEIIKIFPFPAKLKMVAEIQKMKNLEGWGCIITRVCSTQRVQNLLKIALSLIVFKIIDISHFWFTRTFSISTKSQEDG